MWRNFFVIARGENAGVVERQQLSPQTLSREGVKPESANKHGVDSKAAGFLSRPAVFSISPGGASWTQSASMRLPFVVFPMGVVVNEPVPQHQFLNHNGPPAISSDFQCKNQILTTFYILSADPWR